MAEAPTLGPARRERLARGWLCLLLLVPAYCLVFAPLGASDPDDGLSLALAARVGRGELPYVDFVYGKPPLSLYLHALALSWLPLPVQLIAGRVAFYAAV